MRRVLGSRAVFVALACLAVACSGGAQAKPLVPASPDTVASDAWAPRVEPTSVLWERSIVVNGVERSFLVYRPTRVVLTPAPLVIVVHGLGNTAHGVAQQSHFDLQAEKSGFIAIFPQGLENSFNSGYYGCCGSAVSKRVDDVAFVSKLIDLAVETRDVG